MNLPDFSKGLVPVVTQEYRTRKVLMQAFVNEDAYMMSLEERRAIYWSTSRNEIWKKGDTSGDIQPLKQVYVSNDLSSVLYVVEQEGTGACHTGAYSCFFKGVESEQPDFEKRNGIVAIAQNYMDKEVLMIGIMDKTAFEIALAQKRPGYVVDGVLLSGEEIMSGSRGVGEVQYVRKMVLDCDNDSVLLSIEQRVDVWGYRGLRQFSQIADYRTKKEKIRDAVVGALKDFGRGSARVIPAN